MQNYYLIFSLFFLSALLDYSELTYFWQLKEYRLDRFKDFLSTVLGKKFILSYKIIVRPILFLIFIFSFKTFSILALIFAVDILKTLINIFCHRFTRPKFTAKAILLILTAIMLEAVMLLSGYVLLAFSRFLIISLAVFIFYLPTRLLKKIYYKKATAKLARYEKLKVIGVTGSYGKTTVKNFLEQILKAKFKVIKTPKNINTEIGIAKFILNTDFSQTDIFVVEMAAYRIGEIKLICDIVKPSIGILTAINEQHLPLFGNIKNTQTAKYELLRSLPDDGLAIVNTDNPYCREFISELKSKVKTFGLLPNYQPDCLISEITSGSKTIEFKANDYQIITNIIGAYNAMNIAPAILAAIYLGLNKQEIINQCLNLKLPEATMQIISYGKNIIIDDSYNANPEGFKAALNFLAEYQAHAGKKIVITRGMIELGQASDEAHKKIGRLIAEMADELIIISPDSAQELKAGIGDKNITVKNIFNHTELLDYLKNNKNQNNIILLEGRMPEIIKKEISA